MDFAARLHGNGTYRDENESDNAQAFSPGKPLVLSATGGLNTSGQDRGDA